jgi:hypothetical protein
MGTYGFLRFSLPILPDGTRQFVPFIVLLSIIGIVYGALVALAQKDWKRLVAYSSVSHMAMVMLGMSGAQRLGGNIAGQNEQVYPSAGLTDVTGAVCQEFTPKCERLSARAGGGFGVTPVVLSATGKGGERHNCRSRAGESQITRRNQSWSRLGVLTPKVPRRDRARSVPCGA